MVKVNTVAKIIRARITSTTLLLLKIFVFTFVYMPFMAGVFYFVLSPILLLAIPLSSLILCTLDGIRTSYGSALFLSIFASIFIPGIVVVCWIMTWLYKIYSWVLQLNTLMILSIMMMVMVVKFEAHEMIWTIG